MPNNKRWGVLYCPKHELLSPKRRWEKIEKCLKDNGVEYDFIQSESSFRCGPSYKDDDQQRLRNDCYRRRRLCA